MAWLGIALVLALNVFAASPQAHAWVHGREYLIDFRPANKEAGEKAESSKKRSTADEEGLCIITRFSMGHGEHALSFFFVAPEETIVVSELELPAEVTYTVASSLYPPSCGPPLN